MADTIDQLDETFPTNSDLLSVGPADLRDIKNAVKGTFSALGAAGGVVTPSAVELNHVSGVTSSIQGQLDAKLGPIQWERKFIPDIVATPVETHFMIKDTKNLMSIQDGANTTTMQCVLPDTAASTDGDIIFIILGSIPSIFNFRVDGFSSQNMRFLVNNSLDPAFNTWVSSLSLLSINSFPWPYFMCTYSSHYGQWVVRVLNGGTVNTWQ